MDALTPEERALACGVLHERYKTCVKTTVVSALSTADLGSVTARCAPLFADLTELCSEHLRRGELHAPQPGGGGR
jgi:hypothetical protein